VFPKPLVFNRHSLLLNLYCDINSIFLSQIPGKQLLPC